MPTQMFQFLRDCQCCPYFCLISYSTRAAFISIPPQFGIWRIPWICLQYHEHVKQCEHFVSTWAVNGVFQHRAISSSFWSTQKKRGWVSLDYNLTVFQWKSCLAELKSHSQRLCLLRYALPNLKCSSKSNQNYQHNQPPRKTFYNLKTRGRNIT